MSGNKEVSFIGEIVSNGVWIVRAAVLILFLSTILLWGVFEYYRAYPLTEHEMISMQRLVFLASTPAFLVLLYRYLRLVIDRKQYEFDMAKREGNPIRYVSHSPSEEDEISGGDPSPTPSQNSVNTGGYGVDSTGIKMDRGVREDVRKAIFGYIRMNNGLNFKDQSAITRIKSGIIRDVSKEEIENALFVLNDNGEIIGENGVLKLKNPEFIQSMEVKTKKDSIINGTNGKTMLDAIQLKELESMLQVIFPGEEIEVKKHMDIIRASDRSEFNEIHKLLTEQIQMNQEIAMRMGKTPVGI